jgi:hypothetical protein
LLQKTIPFITVKNFGDIYLIGMPILSNNNKELKILKLFVIKLPSLNKKDNCLIFKAKKKDSIFYKKFLSTTSKN